MGVQQIQQAIEIWLVWMRDDEDDISFGIHVCRLESVDDAYQEHAALVA